MAELDKDLYGAKYYDVKLSIEELNDNGKIHKVREEHLVWGSSFKEVEDKVKAEMNGTMNDWKIISIKESEISDIYGEEQKHLRPLSNSGSKKDDDEEEAYDEIEDGEPDDPDAEVAPAGHFSDENDES